MKLVDQWCWITEEAKNSQWQILVNNDKAAILKEHYGWPEGEESMSAALTEREPRRYEAKSSQIRRE